MLHKFSPNGQARSPLPNPLPHAGEGANESLREFHINPTMRNLLFVLLLLGAASGLGYLAMHHHIQRDVTYNASNSLEPSSVEVHFHTAGFQAIAGVIGDVTLDMMMHGEIAQAGRSAQQQQHEQQIAHGWVNVK